MPAFPGDYTERDVKELAEGLLNYTVEEKDYVMSESFDNPTLIANTDIPGDNLSRFEEVASEATPGGTVGLMKDIYDEIAEQYDFTRETIVEVAGEDLDTDLSGVSVHQNYSKLGIESSQFAEEVVRDYAEQAGIDQDLLETVGLRKNW